MKKLILFFTFIITALQALALYDVTVTDRLRVWAEFPDPIIADGVTVNYIKVYQHDDDDLSYSAFNLEFILPEGFRINQVKQGRDKVDDIFFSERATTTHLISCNIVDGVDLRIIGDSSQNSDLYNDDIDGNPLDELFTIGLIAEKTMLPGSYEVRMEGIKFCHSNADARVPEADPAYYTIHVTNNDIETGIQEISADNLDPDNCFDLLGNRVNPHKIHDMIIICNGIRYYIR